MYGKIFASLFTGSMRGKGDLQLVFTYMISNATDEGICDFTPQCISDATGKPIDLIQRCLTELEAPDDMSRTRSDDGRRIRKLDPSRPWGWQIINYQMYRAIATRDSMREAERLRKREYRSRINEECPGHQRDNTGIHAYDNASDIDKCIKDFADFWSEYPRKVGKKEAFRAWKKAKDRPSNEVIIAALKLQKKSDQWTKENGQYIPLPATWLNQGRWDDEPQQQKRIEWTGANE